MGLGKEMELALLKVGSAVGVSKNHIERACTFIVAQLYGLEHKHHRKLTILVIQPH